MMSGMPLQRSPRSSSPRLASACPSDKRRVQLAKFSTSGSVILQQRHLVGALNVLPWSTRSQVPRTTTLPRASLQVSDYKIFPKGIVVQRNTLSSSLLNTQCKTVFYKTDFIQFYSCETTPVHRVNKIEYENAKRNTRKRVSQTSGQIPRVLEYAL